MLFSKPVHLFRFRMGARTWLRIADDRPRTIGMETFLPSTIERSKIRDSGERAKNRITITMPVDDEIADNWRPYPPPRPVFVSCMSLDRDTLTVDVEWSGRVISPKYSYTQLELTCEQTGASARVRGRHLRWMRGCPLALYSQGPGLCNLDPDTVKMVGTLSGLSGNQATAMVFGLFPDGRLNGGFIRWTRPDGEQDVRSILNHTGTVVELLYGSDQLPLSTEIEVLPGCAHDEVDCDSYGNGPNYGGHKYLPVKSPFDGNPVQ